jgi:hypothetical protein
VEGGGGGLAVSGVSRNGGSFVKCVAIQKRLGIPALVHEGAFSSFFSISYYGAPTLHFSLSCNAVVTTLLHILAVAPY